MYFLRRPVSRRCVHGGVRITKPLARLCCKSRSCLCWARKWSRQPIPDGAGQSRWPGSGTTRTLSLQRAVDVYTGERLVSSLRARSFLDREKKNFPANFLKNSSFLTGGLRQLLCECFTTSKQALTILANYEIWLEMYTRAFIFSSKLIPQAAIEKQMWAHISYLRHIPQSAPGTPSFARAAHEDEWTLSVRSVSGISSSAL